MFMNTVYIPKDLDVSEKTTESKPFFLDKETKNFNRYTHIVSDKVDEKQALQVTVTIEPVKPKTVRKKATKTRTRKK